MPEGDLKAVTEKYSAHAPKPLNTQFPDRRGKEEAVQLHAGRKKRMATELYPPGIFTVVITCFKIAGDFNTRVAQ